MQPHVLVTSPEQIQALIAQAVREAVRSELPSLLRRATRKPFLTQDEAREVTGWSARTLQNLRDTKQIPFVQHGRKISYPTDDLYSYLESHSVRPRCTSTNINH